uniref:Kinesin-like protein KIF14 n=1 Tax=Ascaris suum TaxID=6253 RepID=F1KSC6_ASCSU
MPTRSSDRKKRSTSSSSADICDDHPRRLPGRSRSDQRGSATIGPQPRSRSASRAVDATKCTIQVAVRVRPFMENESRENGLVVRGNRVHIRSCNREFFFELSHIFDSTTTQQEVYQKLAMPLLTHALSGINVCLFAYGQTGSGKTYSIVGNREDPGVLQRFCEDFFDAVAEVKLEERSLTAAFYEIYQEKAYDLLGDVREPLRIRGGEQAYLKGLTEATVTSFAEFEKLRQRAWAKRATASTAFNRQSSRSHAVVRLIYQRSVNEKAGAEARSFAITSQIHFVDLAGSERVVHSGYSHMEETIAINVSLSALHRVISSAAEGVPCGFRDSILTRLLKECFIGNARTAMLATVSPSNDSCGETLSTLRFATHAAAVCLKPRVNVDPFLELMNNLRAENEQLKEKLATFEDVLQPTLFVRPEAPCVIELQRDPALITWQPLIKELAYSPCGNAEMIVGFTLGVEEEAIVEAYGEGVYLNGEPLMPRRAQQLNNADRVVVRDERFFIVLLDENDESNILVRHSFSSVRLEFVEHNFERVRVEVEADKKADAEREKQQLMEEIDEELKERKQELDEGYQKLSGHKGSQAKESSRLAELRTGLENLNAFRESFITNADRAVENSAFEARSSPEKEEIMHLKSEVDRVNFILRRFRKENIYDFKLKVIDRDGDSKPCVRFTDRRIKMYGDVSPTEFEAMAERLAEMNVQCTVVTEQERERMGEMLFLMCRDIPNLVKIGGGRPSTIMHTAIVNSTNEAVRRRRTTAAEFRKSLLGSRRSTISTRLLGAVKEVINEEEEESALERQFVGCVLFERTNSKERWQSTEGGGVIILLDALSQMQKSMAKLRCIDKRLIKGMPFYANINAFSLMATQIEVVMRVLSSPEAVPADADSSVSEVVVELRHFLSAFDSWLSNFEDDNSEIRALVVDNMEGMFPRIYTTLGKAAFWMDQRLHEKQLPPEVNNAYMIGLRAAVDEVSDENEDICRRFSVMPSIVAQIITRTSEALREACALSKETLDERLLFGVVRPMFVILRASGRFNADSMLRQLVQVLDRARNLSLPQSERLVVTLREAVHQCSSVSAPALRPLRPPTRPRLPSSLKNA